MNYFVLEKEFAQVLSEAVELRPANDPELQALRELDNRRRLGKACPDALDRAVAKFRGHMTERTVDLSSHWWWLKRLVDAGTAEGDALRVKFQAAADKWEVETLEEEEVVECVEAFYADPRCASLLNGWSAFRAWPQREELRQSTDKGDLRRVLEFCCYGDRDPYNWAEQIFILSEDICPVKVQVAAGTTQAEVVEMLKRVVDVLESESRWQALVSSMDVDGVEFFARFAMAVKGGAGVSENLNGKSESMAVA